MSYIELYQKSPGLFVLVLIVSLVVTLLVYGAFPIIFAKLRKTPITKKKYNLLCYGINFIGVIFFVALNGAASGAPYILWTGVFSYHGAKILTKKELLLKASTKREKTTDTEAAEETPPTFEASEEAASETAEHTPGAAKRYCSKCGQPIDALTKKCTGCGKQYFKGVKHCLRCIPKLFTKKLLPVTVLSVVLLISIVFNITLSFKLFDQKSNLSSLETLLDAYRNENNRLESENNRLNAAPQIYSVNYVLQNWGALMNSTFYVEAYVSTNRYWAIETYGYNAWMYCCNSVDEVYFPTGDDRLEFTSNDHDRAVDKEIINVFWESSYNDKYLSRMVAGDHVLILCEPTNIVEQFGMITIDASSIIPIE